MAGGGAERERESVGFDASIEYKQTEEPKIKDINGDFAQITKPL